LPKARPRGDRSRKQQPTRTGVCLEAAAAITDAIKAYAALRWPKGVVGVKDRLLPLAEALPATHIVDQ